MYEISQKITKAYRSLASVRSFLFSSNCPWKVSIKFEVVNSKVPTVLVKVLDKSFECLKMILFSAGIFHFYHFFHPLPASPSVLWEISRSLSAISAMISSFKFSSSKFCKLKSSIASCKSLALLQNLRAKTLSKYFDSNFWSKGLIGFIFRLSEHFESLIPALL